LSVKYKLLLQTVVARQNY